MFDQTWLWAKQLQTIPQARLTHPKDALFHQQLKNAFH